MTQDPEIVNKEQVKPVVNDKNDDPARPSIDSKLEQRGRGGKYFTFYNPIRNEARAQKQRRKDREVASKVVTWKKYSRYCRTGKQSCLNTCLNSGIIPLLTTMGICFICWGVNENVVGVTPTYLYYPVIFVGVVFLFSCLFLILGIHLYKRSIFFICLGFLFITLVLQIFVMVWINYRAEPYYLKSFLMDLLHSYRPKEKDAKTLLMDNIQTYFSCCGVTTYKDWLNTKTFSRGGLKNETLPRTCCIFPNPNVHKTRLCYATTNKSDDTMWALQTKGCLNPLKKFLANFELKNWIYNGLGIIVVVLAFIISLIYVLQTFNKFHKGINPEVYQMVCRLVNNLMDKYFAKNEDKNSIFNPTFRDFVHLELKRCKNLEEIVNLLPTLSDTLYYVKFTSPEGLANHILKGKSKLVTNFENGLRRIRDKKHQEKKVKEIESIVEKSYDHSQAPQNSVEDVQDLSFSPKFGTIVVPHELKRRMKNVELFLVDFNRYEMKSAEKQRKKNTKAKTSDDSESLEVKFLRMYRETSDASIAQRLNEYRKSTLGSSHIIEVLGRQRFFSQPLVGTISNDKVYHVKKLTIDSTINADENNAQDKKEES